MENLTYNPCRLCPRACGADRSRGELGFCRCPDGALVAKAMLHKWEEPVLAGQGGSGAVFFGGCTLGCRYCQNAAISRGAVGKAMDREELRKLFESLIAQGAENIDLVTPTQYLPTILPALTPKLSVPVVYNSGGYERPEVLEALAGAVDIFLPDMKYADSALAQALSGAKDYFPVAAAAIRKMAEITGPVEISGDKAKKGTILRHLILPGHTKNSIACLERIRQLFPGIPVSLMAQYTPCGELDSFPELGRPITRREQEKVENALFDLGLEGYTQSRKAKGAQYVPDWDMG